MGYNLIPCDRTQTYLLPPSLEDWLPPDHLARFIVGVVDRLDLGAFYRRRRDDGWGRAAYDPNMMVALLLYAYCTGVRSAREIERRCREDIAFRFICANNTPDHATIARFRADHEEELSALLVQALGLCLEVGLGRLGVVALDGRKVKANASGAKNRTRDHIAAQVKQILDEARATDAAEDGVAPSAELPRPVVDVLSRLDACLQRLDAEDEARQADYERQLARRRERRVPGPGPKPPHERKKVRRLSKVANTTDPESRVMKTAKGFQQSYNSQAMVTEDQIVIAADVTQDPTDVGQLRPMVDQAKENLATAQPGTAIGVVVADAGYYSDDNAASQAEDGPEMMIAVANASRQLTCAPKGRIPTHLTSKQRMERRLATKRGRALYRRRAETVEPVFGQQVVRGFDRMSRRGLEACRAELRFDLATHNLLKLWRSGRWISRSPALINTRHGSRDASSRRNALPRRVCRCAAAGA